jgi:hypothetical protein
VGARRTPCDAYGRDGGDVSDAELVLLAANGEVDMNLAAR